MFEDHHDAILLLLAVALAACGAADDANRNNNVVGGADGGTVTNNTQTALAGCKPILLCAGQCNGDATCVDDCKMNATTEGADLFNALSTCGGQNGCDNLQCTYELCRSEFDACQGSIGVGGYVCFAEGFYDQCDQNTNCATYSAVGAAWGATDAKAAGNALIDCTTFMTNLIAIASISGAASVNESCVVTSCGPHE